MTARATEPGLVRALGPVTLALMVATTIVGAGIIGLPSVAYAAAGDEVWAALTLAAIVACGFALVFRALATRFDRAGGPYLYARAAFGAWLAVPTGALMVVTRVLSGATMLSILLDQTGLGGVARIAAACAVTVALTGVLLGGVRQSATVMNGLAMVKLGGLGALTLAGLAAAIGAAAPAPAPAGTHFVSGILAFTYALAGFETVSIVAGEASAPRRDLPAAILFGVALAAAFYAALMFACLRLLPGLADMRRPLVNLADTLLPGVAPYAATVAVALLLSSLGMVMLTTPRLVYAMALDGVLPRGLARLHPRWRTPTAAIVAVAASVLASVFLALQTLVDVGTVARLVTWGVSAGAYARLRWRGPAPVAAA